ncbi:carbon-nitrogen hydrolase [Daldinia loculata]|uniref:carbon-nitrogen hydrolase n=1 Tax=Daldinia loculata TaxID=103429 RepID=UPI0020C45CCE|nr:carbon-nitrogen hydrolase [Daldinia loculata]KAI1650482.1 carbon-nitrogen hydrolase [Daldinia loculata]
MTTIRVAVIQAEPVWLDLAGSIRKACELIAEAAGDGAKIVAFAEAFVPGYPAWIWARPVDFELQTRYIYNSLAIESEEMEQVKAVAKKHSIAVILGFSERSPSNSTYIAQAIISPQGELALHRRKIKPTHMERTVFGDGSGNDLTNVAELDFGAPLGKIKVGALACWEHTQPLLKYHSITQGGVIHVSMWPPIDPTTGVDHPGLWSMTADGCQNLSQTYAIESGAYVLHATSVCTQAGIDVFNTQNGLICAQTGGGHSCIIGPDGRRLTSPLGDGKPETGGILYGDLDLTKVVANRGFLDIVGHYSRPDLLWLGVDKQQKEVVISKADIKKPESEQETARANRLKKYFIGI